VVRYVGEKPSSAKTCRWCRLVETEEHVLYDEPAFIVVEPLARARGGYVTLVPKTHVSVITELPLAQMAAVLAGLSRASDRMRGSGAGGVNVRSHPSGSRRGRGHVHFNLMPVTVPATERSEEMVNSSSAFASLVEAISH
jgi:diadenosine tetraphosphate (Ap4A) HIT family hydrolase